LRMTCDHTHQARASLPPNGVCELGMLGQVFSRPFATGRLYCEVNPLDLTAADPFPYSGTFRW
jgi:hypothetical protein